MPNILFLIQSKNERLTSEDKNPIDFLLEQSELLARFLNQQGFQTTVALKPSPLRLFSQKFDLIHIFSHHGELSPQTLALIGVAKALNIGLVLTIFGSKTGSKTYLNFFDAITLTNLSLLNSLRHIDRIKIIYPGLIRSTESKKNQRTQSSKLMSAETEQDQKKQKADRVFIFPILSSIDELPQKIHLNESKIVVDATLCTPLVLKNLKLAWHDWKSQNLLFENSSLVAHTETRESIAQTSDVVLVTSHLRLSAEHLLHFCEFAQRSKCRWIVNQDQASAFSQVWSKFPNRIITDESLTFLDQTFDHIDPFLSRDIELNEPKLNEISRTYQKVLSKMSSQVARQSDKLHAV